jgi:predicted GNAT family N-acyltransferase
MDDFNIDSFKKGEEFLISDLIKSVYNECVAPDYSAAGNNFFYAYIDPAQLADRFSNGNALLTAKINGTIIGMLELRDQNHISLLFVNKLWHGKGIAKKLVKKAVSLVLEKDKSIRFFEVNASPFSEKIYAKMGFKKTDDMQNVNGLKFVPMIMEIEVRYKLSENENCAGNPETLTSELTVSSISPLCPTEADT